MNIVISFVLGAGIVAIAIILGVVLGMLKDFIVKKIAEHSKKTFRIVYANLFDGKIEQEGIFGRAYVRVYERQYMIVRAKNLASAMDKFNKELDNTHYYFPKYAVLDIIEETEVK